MYEDKHYSCEDALVNICKDFLNYLNQMKRNGLISEAEYEAHSRVKRDFINLINQLQKRPV